MKAFFTGHRQIVLRSIYQGIEQLIDFALNEGVDHFYSGMALGVDQAAASKLHQKSLAWTAVIPCKDQPKLWTKQQRQEYRDLLKLADKKIVLAESYADGVMQARNAWMIRRSQICLAVFDGRAGGTKSTVELAINRGLIVAVFNPNKGEMEIVQKAKQLSLL